MTGEMNAFLYDDVALQFIVSFQNVQNRYLYFYSITSENLPSNFIFSKKSFTCIPYGTSPFTAVVKSSPLMIGNTILIIYRTTGSLTDLYYRLLDLETLSFSNQTLLLDKSANIQGLNELLRCRLSNATSFHSVSALAGTIECFLFFEANYFKELVFTYSLDDSKQFQIKLAYSNSYDSYLNNIYEDVTWSDQYVLVQTVRLAVTDQTQLSHPKKRTRLRKETLEDPITDPNDFRSIMVYLRGANTPFIYRGFSWSLWTEECSSKTTILPMNNNTFYIMGSNSKLWSSV
jgi:hypothetical protein